MEATAADRVSEQAEKQLSFQEKLGRNVENLDGIKLKDGLSKARVDLLTRKGIDLAVYEAIYPVPDCPTSYYKVVGPYEICAWDTDEVIIKKNK